MNHSQQAKNMQIHVISIGGSIMHNMGIALHLAGHQVTGSDDMIYEPARTRLENFGLLPKENGWNADNIHSGLDSVLLGMHAKADNPELAKALELGIPIQSFPEWVHQATANKHRLVVAGSHGKTTVSAMIMHTMQACGSKFDYVVGAQVRGFEHSCHFSEDSTWAVIEGDEYLSSALDPRPKFVWYDPDVLIINGIDWDHANVFPTEENYRAQFLTLLEGLREGTRVLYPEDDAMLANWIATVPTKGKLEPVPTPLRVDLNTIEVMGLRYKPQVFGAHNDRNMAVAVAAMAHTGIPPHEAWPIISQFVGASKRLEAIPTKSGKVVYRDFAHAPSKVKATVDAMVSQYGATGVVGILELHTFSSLSPAYLPNYKGSLNGLKEAYLFLDAQALAAKGSAPLEDEYLHDCFHYPKLKIIRSASELKVLLEQQLTEKEQALLLMSSGSLGGLPIIDMISL